MQTQQNTEKVSVNLTIGDLAKIDLLVDNGFFASRSDFIQKGVKSALDDSAADLEDIKRQAERKGDSWGVGILAFRKADFEKAKQKGQKFSILVYGLLILDSDIPLSLLQETVSSIRVHGHTKADPAIKAFYHLK
jgi:Arc/MetJ-type ribon-helix-helix transcriptional regulator